MDITQLLIQLASGAVGGSAAGAVAKDNSLGKIGDAIAGAVGGGLGGQLLGPLVGLDTATAASGPEFGTIISAFATGGVSGGLTAIVLGFIKAKFLS